MLPMQTPSVFVIFHFSPDMLEYILITLRPDTTSSIDLKNMHVSSAYCIILITLSLHTGISGKLVASLLFLIVLLHKE
jgi:hypothetical protein